MNWRLRHLPSAWDLAAEQTRSRSRDRNSCSFEPSLARSRRWCSRRPVHSCHLISPQLSCIQRGVSRTPVHSCLLTRRRLSFPSEGHDAAADSDGIDAVAREVGGERRLEEGGRAPLVEDLFTRLCMAVKRRLGGENGAAAQVLKDIVALASRRDARVQLRACHQRWRVRGAASPRLCALGCYEGCRQGGVQVVAGKCLESAEPGMPRKRSVLTARTFQCGIASSVA